MTQKRRINFAKKYVRRLAQRAKGGQSGDTALQENIQGGESELLTLAPSFDEMVVSEEYWEDFSESDCEDFNEPAREHPFKLLAGLEREVNYDGTK